MRCDPNRTKECAADSFLGRRLHSLRLQRGWNMDHVASAAGISRTTLFHLERNEVGRPRASTLHKLARVFNVAVESLLEECGARNAECGMANRPVPSDAGEWESESGLTPHFALRTPNSCGSSAFDRATNPVVTQVAAERPELFTGWSPDDWDELYSQFATGGALREEGVHATAARINHDREVLYRLRVILQTHLADVASGMVDTLYKLVNVEPVEDAPANEDSDRHMPAPAPG